MSVAASCCPAEHRGRSFDEGKDLEFNLSVELMPEIKPVDFSEIKLEKLVAEANEKDIDEALSKLAEQHKGSEPIKTKRASKMVISS